MSTELRVTIESIYLQSNAKHNTLTSDEPFFVIVFVFLLLLLLLFFYVCLFFFCFVLFLFFAMKKETSDRGLIKRETSFTRFVGIFSRILPVSRI